MLGQCGRHAEPAVAHYHRGYTVPGAWRERRVPEHLGIVVGVDVDESGRHYAARSIDLLARVRRNLPHGDNLAIANAEIPGACGCTGAIDQGATSNGKV